MAEPTAAEIQAILAKIEECARFLEPYGIGLEPILNWSRTLSPEDVARVIQDRDAYLAEAAGVTKEQYQAYHRHDWRCEGKTKAGKRCKKRAAGWLDSSCGMDSAYGCPKDFKPFADVNRFCMVHLGYH